MAMKPDSNPAEGKKGLTLPPNYKPMSVGQRRLETSEIPGYHLHWFRGNAGNIARARQAGYEDVYRGEVEVNDLDLAGGEESGGTDLGDRVSVISGDMDSSKEAGRMYLMKCREDIFEHAQSLVMNFNHNTAAALKGGLMGVGEAGEGQADIEARYVGKRTKIPALFTPRK